jgi:hypothetical protein
MMTAKRGRAPTDISGAASAAEPDSTYERVREGRRGRSGIATRPRFVFPSALAPSGEAGRHHQLTPKVPTMPRKTKPREAKKPRPKKAPKPTGRKPGPKSTFVLTQDPKLSAAEVVKLAAAAGHKLTPRRVHNIRWAAKKKGTTVVKAAPAPKAVKVKARTVKGATKKRKVAAAKPPKPGKTTTKKAYVLSFPAGTTAADVVARAKSEGITISAAHVYAIRTEAKAKAKTRGKATKTPKTPTAKTVAKPAFRSAPRTGGMEEQFVGLVLDIGLTRASELLGKLQERVRQITLG